MSEIGTDGIRRPFKTFPKIGQKVAYEIRWATEFPSWKEVEELEFYRALHSSDCLVEGRVVVYAYGPMFTNEEGVVREISESVIDKLPKATP